MHGAMNCFSKFGGKSTWGQVEPAFEALLHPAAEIAGASKKHPTWGWSFDMTSLVKFFLQGGWCTGPEPLNQRICNKAVARSWQILQHSAQCGACTMPVQSDFQVICSARCCEKCCRFFLLLLSCERQMMHVVGGRMLFEGCRMGRWTEMHGWMG